MQSNHGCTAGNQAALQGIGHCTIAVDCRRPFPIWKLGRLCLPWERSHAHRKAQVLVFLIHVAVKVLAFPRRGLNVARRGFAREARVRRLRPGSRAKAHRRESALELNHAPTRDRPPLRRRRPRFALLPATATRLTPRAIRPRWWGHAVRSAAVATKPIAPSNVPAAGIHSRATRQWFVAISLSSQFQLRNYLIRRAQRRTYVVARAAEKTHPALR